MPIIPIIDHAVINVDGQLDQAYTLFRRMGFQLSSRGHHSMGSSNHLAIFGENYLELLGFEADSDSDKRGLWQVPPGLAGLVWKTTDARFVYTWLQQRELEGESPTVFSRPVTLPDGSHKEAKFCITRLKASSMDYGFSFFCQHFTPEAVWQDVWRQHPNGVQNLTGFVIMAEDPRAAISLFARLFNTAPMPEPNGRGWFIQASAARLRVISRQQAIEEFHLPENRSTGTQMVALSFSVASLGRLTDCLASGGIGFQEMGNRIVVSITQTGWLALSFSAMSNGYYPKAS